MRHTLRSLTLMALVPLLLGTAASAGARERGDAGRSSKETKSTTVKASDYMGKRVKNPQGEDLGKVNDLVIDPRTGSIGYAVLSSGGVLGIGDKLTPVPWNALKRSEKADFLVLDVDKEKLKRAPSFSRDNWPDMTDRRWVTEVNKYYHQRSSPERRRAARG